MTATPEYTFENPHTKSDVFIPGSVKRLAMSIFDMVSHTSAAQPGVDVDKLRGLLESIVNQETENPETGQCPTLGLCPRLRAAPFWGEDDDDTLRAIKQRLTERFSVIQGEYLKASATARGIASTYAASARYKSLDRDAWTGFSIGGMSGFSSRARKLFPDTIEVIKEFESRVFGAEFLVLKSRTVLPPHTDGTNAQIACHLVISTAGQCGLRVRDQTEEMTEGKIVFFDQSFPHSAWNDSDSPRVVLLLSLIHPDITDQEVEVLREFVRRLQKKILVFSPLVAAEMAFHKLLAAMQRVTRRGSRNEALVTR